MGHPEIFIPIAVGVFFGIIGGAFITELFDYKKGEQKFFGRFFFLFFGLISVVPLCIAAVFYDNLNSLSIIIGVCTVPK